MVKWYHKSFRLPHREWIDGKNSATQTYYWINRVLVLDETRTVIDDITVEEFLEKYKMIEVFKDRNFQ